VIFPSPFSLAMYVAMYVAMPSGKRTFTSCSPGRGGSRR